MTNTRALTFLVGATIALAPALSLADTACPTAVTDAAKKAFPDATITKCKAEDKSFEVKLTKKDKSVVELDISAKGDIEQIEEIVPVASLPAAVTKAFAAKYPKAKADRAEKQTKADKTVSYELAFALGKDRKEATFTADGAFVEEE